VCYDRTAATFAYVADHDASSSTVKCVKLSDVTDVTRLAYYAARLLKALKPTVPPP
jgi:hypothetical protein